MGGFARRCAAPALIVLLAMLTTACGGGDSRGTAWGRRRHGRPQPDCEVRDAPDIHSERSGFRRREQVARKDDLRDPITSEVPFMSAVERGMQQAAREVGAELVVYPNQGKPTVGARDPDGDRQRATQSHCSRKTRAPRAQIDQAKGPGYLCRGSSTGEESLARLTRREAVRRRPASRAVRAGWPPRGRLGDQDRTGRRTYSSSCRTTPARRSRSSGARRGVPEAVPSLQSDASSTSRSRSGPPKREARSNLRSSATRRSTT